MATNELEFLRKTLGTTGTLADLQYDYFQRFTSGNMNAMTFRGNWDVAAIPTYITGQVVSYGGSEYMKTATGDGTETPGTGSAWTKIQGAAGSPGGLVYGTLIVKGTDWNSYATDGLYRAVDSTGANNPPMSPSPYGSMIVTKADTDRILQTFYPLTAVSTGRYIYQRSSVASVWGPWRSILSSRVDQTAGRAIYMWDDLNSRDQLIYGDTGVRNISASLLNGWTGTVNLTRENNSVYLNVQGLTGGTGDIFQFPTGFIPLVTERPLFHWADSITTVKRGSINTSGLWQASALVGSETYYGSIVWRTNQSWPTSLPGTANGSIPYN